MTDRRLHPCNGRVAHDSLKGQVEGVTFVCGTLKSIVKPVVGLLAKAGGAMDRQLIFGETFLELEQDKTTDYSFGRAECDGYVGYIEAYCLAPVTEVTHKVSSLNTHIYPKANMKTVPLMALPMGARLEVISVKDGFAELRTGGFIPTQAITLIDTFAADPVAVAEQFIGVAYLWGGDSYQGIDCSALVQTAFRACGHPCPRDSDMQQNRLGLEFGDNTPMRRGDLIFWNGHVGMMTDTTTLLHANAHHMRVTAEPLAEVAARILKAEGLEIACCKRPNLWI